MDALFASPLGALVIFLLRICDVSLDTLRVLFAFRGQRAVAAILGFCVALIWIVAVGNAVRHLDSAWHILAYAAGYATGTFVGITIERTLAYGLATVRVISRHGGVEIAEGLRDRGYGVTETSGYGREGHVEIVDAVVQRAHLPQVMTIVDRFDPAAFVTIAEPKILRGGSIAEREGLVNRLSRARVA